MSWKLSFHAQNFYYCLGSTNIIFVSRGVLGFELFEAISSDLGLLSFLDLDVFFDDVFCFLHLGSETLTSSIASVLNSSKNFVSVWKSSINTKLCLCSLVSYGSGFISTIIGDSSGLSISTFSVIWFRRIFWLL